MYSSHAHLSWRSKSYVHPHVITNSLVDGQHYCCLSYRISTRHGINVKLLHDCAGHISWCTVRSQLSFHADRSFRLMLHGLNTIRDIPSSNQTEISVTSLDTKYKLCYVNCITHRVQFYIHHNYANYYAPSQPLPVSQETWPMKVLNNHTVTLHINVWLIVTLMWLIVTHRCLYNLNPLNNSKAVAVHLCLSTSNWNTSKTIY